MKTLISFLLLMAFATTAHAQNSCSAGQCAISPLMQQVKLVEDSVRSCYSDLLAANRTQRLLETRCRGIERHNQRLINDNLMLVQQNDSLRSNLLISESLTQSLQNEQEVRRHSGPSWLWWAVPTVLSAAAIVIALTHHHHAEVEYRYLPFPLPNGNPQPGADTTIIEVHVPPPLPFFGRLRKYQCSFASG